MKTFDDDVREFITAQIENVELDGLCPICGTGRSRNGECWRGHIVINVRRPTSRSVNGAYVPDVSDIALKDMIEKNGGG